MYRFDVLVSFKISAHHTQMQFVFSFGSFIVSALSLFLSLFSNFIFILDARFASSFWCWQFFFFDLDRYFCAENEGQKREREMTEQDEQIENLSTTDVCSLKFLLNKSFELNLTDLHLIPLENSIPVSFLQRSLSLFCVCVFCDLHILICEPTAILFCFCWLQRMYEKKVFAEWMWIQAEN